MSNKRRPTTHNAKRRHRAAKGPGQARRVVPLVPAIAAVALLAAASIAFISLRPVLFGVSIRTEPALTGIYVAHKGAWGLPPEDLMIPYVSITSLEVLSERPELTKVSGFQGRHNLIGTFQAEGLGQVRVYATDYR